MSLRRKLFTFSAVSLSLTALSYLHLVGLLAGDPPSKVAAVASYSYRGCEPTDKVVFAKTHKCAGSTVQNVLLRRALEKNLTVALPLEGNYFSDVPKREEPFKRDLLKSTPWDEAGLEYDMFLTHSVFEFGEMSALIPGARFVTILRDPVEAFASAWDYLRLEEKYGVPLERYALEDKSFSRSPFRDRAHSPLGRNQMLLDLGLGRRHFDEEEKVDEKIKEIDSQFHLVMIAERFEESMLLLRDLLCWDFGDVTHLSLNSQLGGRRSNISERARGELRRWMAADQKLYDHFSAKFQTEAERYGSARMDQDLRILRSAQENLARRCGFRAEDSAGLEQEFKHWVGGGGIVGYRIETKEGDNFRHFCRLYALTEISLLDEARRAQIKRIQEEKKRKKKSRLK